MSGELEKLTAAKQLEALRLCPSVTARLIKLGLSEGDAKAVAYNTSVVFAAMKNRPKSVFGVLDIFSLEEIAALSRRAEEITDEY